MTRSQSNEHIRLPPSSTDERGATAVEYALIAAAIAGVVGASGQQVLDIFTTVEGAF